ncbi:hypothetical protein HY414_01050 [Candidatus Kaiserbacteria bacterium]|nr:hypothetical protein [Candidatus Kaiserbacteria bacterium]
MSDESVEHDEQKPNHRQLLAILESHGLKVHESDVRDLVPAAVSHEGLEALKPRGVQILGELVGRCRSYLSGVYVKDSFGDTLEGRQKRQNTWSALEKEYGAGVSEIQREDKLKMGSSVGGIKTYFEWLVRELDADSVRSGKANAIRELYKHFLATIPFTEKEGQMTMKEEYVEKSFDEKVAVARQIEGVLGEFLGLVTRSR